ncbi:MAG: hypothetical protein BroJett004_07880 [Planctomycetota bacterium]|nr:MAG: hypothetical protein BroJett004_07880 [Planctomycetota bacterium]
MSAHRQGCCCVVEACGCCDTLGERCGWIDCLPADVHASVSASYNAPPVGIAWGECCYLDPPGAVSCFAQDDPGTTNGCTYFISAYGDDEGGAVVDPCGFTGEFARFDTLQAQASCQLPENTVNHPGASGPHIWKFGTTPLTGQIIELQFTGTSEFSKPGMVADSRTVSLVLWIAIDTGGYAGYVQVGALGSDEDEILSPSLSVYHEFPCGGLVVAELDLTVRSSTDPPTACQPGGSLDWDVHAIVACHFDTAECPAA